MPSNNTQSTLPAGELWPKMETDAKKTGLNNPCIYKVPENLRKLNEGAYTPSLVSIGPLHIEVKYLQPRMQEIKVSYVHSLLSRVPNTDAGAEGVLKECLDKMENLKPEALECYAEESDRAQLNEYMLVIDGCFILELLCRHYLYIKDLDKLSGDLIFIPPLIRITVLHDLLLLENQLPYRVLEELFHLTVARILDRPDGCSLVQYVESYCDAMMNPEPDCTNDKATTKCGFLFKTNCSPGECVLSFRDIMTNSEEGKKCTARPEVSGYYHILHFLQKNYVGNDQSESKEKDRSKLMPCASDLDKAGVKFVAPPQGKNLFNVDFKDRGWCCRARFEIPTWRINDYTDRIFRNLIAFEQCYPSVSRYFSSYASLMNKLVNTEDDVKVLEDAGVIHLFLGTREKACDLINNLGKEVVVRHEFLFPKICKKATEYSKRSWSKAIPATTAYVRRKYVGNPWTFKAFVVAFIILGIQVTNFIRTFVG